MNQPEPDWDKLDDLAEDDGESLCHTCHGDGWVVVGLDVDCWDGVNGPFDNEAIECPNCHGSGKADDCTYW